MELCGRRCGIVGMYGVLGHLCDRLCRISTIFCILLVDLLLVEGMLRWLHWTSVIWKWLRIRVSPPGEFFFSSGFLGKDGFIYQGRSHGAVDIGDVSREAEDGWDISGVGA